MKAETADLVNVARRALIEEMSEPGVSITNPLDAVETVAAFFQLSLAHHDHRECFGVLFCDAKLRMIDFEEVFLGTIDGCAVYPREVARLCLEKGADAIFLTHNHPSDSCHPSKADMDITKRLCAVVELFDIRIVDHIIVSKEGNYFSMLEKGLMDEPKRQPFLKAAESRKPVGRPVEQQGLLER